MIKHIFRIKCFWKVIVYYNIDYDFYFHIDNDLKDIDVSGKTRSRIYHNMSKGKAKGVTITNPEYKTSVVLFNKHTRKLDYINTIVHETKHIQSDICKYYNINENSEDAAYLIGYLVEKIMMIIKTNLLQ